MNRKLKTYHCNGVVTGGKYLGEVRARSPKEAIEKAFLELDASVSLCHQCSGECEGGEIQEIILECEGEDVTPPNDHEQEVASLRAEVERLTAERDQARNQFVELAKLLLPEPGEPKTDGNKIVIPLSDSPLLRRMTELMITALKSGPGNFHTVTFQATKDGQEYSLTIQREGGKTPAQKLAELTADIERRTNALERCRDKFREYSKIHRDKGTYDGDRKARANEAMDAMCDEALKGGKG